jgi:hypothetical protein
LATRHSFELDYRLLRFLGWWKERRLYDVNIDIGGRDASYVSYVADILKDIRISSLRYE